ncbi:MAG: cytochrome c biogenesis protein ResB, partial [Carboxydocellales bacterium]
IIILFLNTLACTIQQMKILNKTNGEFFKQDTLSGKTDNTFPVYRQEAKKLNQLIINFLTNKGLAYSYNDNVYRIEKNQWGKYSSIVFHISLLIMLLGFAADALLRMEGTIVLTEGQTRMEQHAAYA